MGPIFTDAEIDDQWPSDNGSNLHAQLWQTVRRLASIERIEFQSADNPAKDFGIQWATALARSTAMKCSERVGQRSRNVYFVAA